MSSTAGTVQSESGDTPWQAYPDADLTSNRSFSVTCRQRVERFVEDPASGPPPLTTSPPLSATQFIYASVSSSTGASTIAGVDEAVTDDQDLELTYLNGLREFAMECIRSMDYDLALTFLVHAMSLTERCGQGSTEQRRMRILMTLCYFFQGRWKLAEPHVRALARVKADLTVCKLLHALALGLVSEYSQGSFEDALSVCKQALHGKRRLCEFRGVDPQEYNETLGLYAEILSIKGDYLRAEFFQSQIPEDFVYIHLPNATVFIQSQSKMLRNLLGEVPISLLRYPHTGVSELGSADQIRGPPARPSKLQKRLAKHKMYELDTSKEYVDYYCSAAQSPNDGDDEASPPSTPSPHSASSTLSFREHFGRFFGNGRHRQPAEIDQSLVEEVLPESPSSISSATSAFSNAPLWCFAGKKLFQLGKAGNRLRKKSDARLSPLWRRPHLLKDKAAFFLPRIHRSPLSDIAKPLDSLRWSLEAEPSDSDYSMSNFPSPDDEESVKLTFEARHSLVTPGSVIARTGANSPSLSCLFELNDSMIMEIGDTSMPAELPNTEVASCEIPHLRSSDDMARGSDPVHPTAFNMDEIVSPDISNTSARTISPLHSGLQVSPLSSTRSGTVNRADSTTLPWSERLPRQVSPSSSTASQKVSAPQQKLNSVVLSSQPTFGTGSSRGSQVPSSRSLAMISSSSSLTNVENPLPNCHAPKITPPRLQAPDIDQTWLSDVTIAMAYLDSVQDAAAPGETVASRGSNHTGMKREEPTVVSRPTRRLTFRRPFTWAVNPEPALKEIIAQVFRPQTLPRGQQRSIAATVEVHTQNEDMNIDELVISPSFTVESTQLMRKQQQLEETVRQIPSGPAMTEQFRELPVGFDGMHEGEVETQKEAIIIASHSSPTPGWSYWLGLVTKLVTY